MRDRAHTPTNTFPRGLCRVRGLSLGVWIATAVFGGWLSPANCFGDDPPCTDADILQVDPVKRVQSALEMIRKHCMTIPGPIWQAAQQSRWSDGVELAGQQRALVVSTAIAAGHAPAESLVIHCLESGKWPGGEALTADTGAILIEGMGPVLNRYRVGLFLDIYEQVPDPEVQAAVVRALVNSDRPEARLPALDAWFRSTGARPDAKTALAISDQNPAEPMLARLVADLPEGPALDWALRLAREAKVAPALEAAKTRGK